METTNETSQPINGMSDSKGYNLIREVCLLTFLGVGFLLNVLALVALKQMRNKSGHYAIVMGLVSSNVVSNVTLLALIPFTVRNIHNQVLFITMFPLSLSTYLVSVVHVVCISIERLVAVAKPRSYRRLFSCRRMKMTVAGVWVVAVISHASIVFCNVNVFELTSVRYLRFVMFRPYLLLYYTVGLVITFVVYTTLLVCLGFKTVGTHHKVAPSEVTSGGPRSRSNRNHSAFNINASGSRIHGDLARINENTDNKTILVEMPEEENQGLANHGEDVTSQPLTHGNGVQSRVYPDRQNKENLQDDGGEDTDKKEVVFVNKTSPVRDAGGEDTDKKEVVFVNKTSPVICWNVSESHKEEHLPPFRQKPESGRQDISVTENSNATSVMSSTTTRIHIRKLREPKAVITIGVLIFFHLLTGMATLVSYGVIGENALSHPKLFGLPVFMIAINSLFDPFFYVVSSIEVRKAVKEVFTFTSI